MKSNAIDFLLLGTLTVVLAGVYWFSQKWFNIVLGMSLLYVGVHGLINMIYWWHRTRNDKRQK